MSTSKTGKHGHAKVHMVALDIFDGKKLEDICPSTHNMECPIVKRTELQLIDMDEEGFVTLMDDQGETRDDLQAVDPEVRKEIQGKIDAERTPSSVSFPLLARNPSCPSRTWPRLHKHREAPSSSKIGSLFNAGGPWMSSGF